MTEQAPRRPRPNRRYRRLVPTAVAVAALAAAGSGIGAPRAHAAGSHPAPPKRAHVHRGPARAAVVPRRAGALGRETAGVGSA